MQLDGTDSDLFWNGSEENGNVRSECEEDGDSDTDCKSLIESGLLCVSVV
jgi:hypothetical protein